MVHDEWTVDTVNLGGTAGVLALVPFLLLGLGQELFCCKEAGNDSTKRRASKRNGDGI